MRTRIVSPIAALVLIMLISSAALARIISPYSIDRLAKDAPAIAVGEVMESGPAGTPSREERGAWIEDMKAQVRILRVPTYGQHNGLAVGDVITLWYERYDWEKTQCVLDGYSFPVLTAGDCYAFPLIKKNDDGEERWRLIDRENNGLLVPCLKDSPKGPAPQSTRDFLVAEFANTLARGQSADVAKTASYLTHSYTNGDSLAADLHDRIAAVVGKNEERWLEIGVVAYNSMGIPRPTIAEAMSGKDQSKVQAALAGKALNHLPKAGLDERIIKAVFRYAQMNEWGAAMTLVDNYSGNPATLKIVKQELSKGAASALDMSRHLITDTAKPDKGLLDAAVDGSLKLIRRPAQKPYVGISSASWWIRHYGSDTQFGVLLKELEKSRITDHEKFLRMWWGLASAEDNRLLPVARIVLEDCTPIGKATDQRVCDDAIFELQTLTKVDFGGRPNTSLQERDAAVAKAKEWLAKNVK